MPRGDRSGPLGLGPMSGRAAGYCAGYGEPGYMNSVPGRGLGRGGGGGRGGGRGRRNWYDATGMPGWARAGAGMPAWGGVAYGGAPFAPPAAPGQELSALRAQAERLEDALEDIKKRIDETEAQTAADETR